MLKNSPKTPYLIIVILVVMMAFLYFSKPSGHKQEVERLQGLIKKHKAAMDSSGRVAEHWQRVAAENFQAFSTAQTNALKAEQKFNYLREENEILKNRPVVRYSEPQLDSVFTRYDR